MSPAVAAMRKLRAELLLEQFGTPTPEYHPPAPVMPVAAQLDLLRDLDGPTLRVVGAAS